jgi:catalase
VHHREVTDMWKAFSRPWQLIELHVTTVGVVTLVSINSFLTRTRMSHENGIALAGRLRIVDDPQFPPHEFFSAAREFGCRIRHGAASFTDDAKMVVRSASLKFADARDTSPFDLIMNSGRTSLFWTARMFVQFMRVTLAGRGKEFVPYLAKYPLSVEATNDGVRRDPTSFAEMSYYSQTVFGFVGLDGVRRYVRYRIIPRDYGGGDSGMPSAEDRRHPWLQNPYDDETRSRNYLKDEIAARIARTGGVHYKLQLQLRDWPDAVSPEFISSGLIWSETEFPWRDVADITLDRALDYAESMLTSFDIGNHPPSLPVPPATSIDDYHSINHLRLKGWPARKARLLSYRLFGMLPKFPDSRQAPDWYGIPPMVPPPARVERPPAG